MVFSPVAHPGPQPLRVLCLSAFGSLGGAERSLLELLQTLPRETIRPYVALPPEGALGQDLQRAGIPVFPLSFPVFRRTWHPGHWVREGWRTLQAQERLTKFIKEEKIGLLHANNLAALPLAICLARRTALPLAWHVRDVRLPPWPFRPPFRRLWAIAISGFTEDFLRKEGMPKERIRKVENGIDLSRFPAGAEKIALGKALRHSLRIPPTAPILLDLGQATPWKRHELFLEVLSQARIRHKDTMGLMAGQGLPRGPGLLDGPSLKGGPSLGGGPSHPKGYIRFLEREIAERGLGPDAFRLLGEWEDVPALLAASNILVSSSGPEPFGRVLVEAAAAGVPVVSTASGAKGEIVEHGVTGLLTAEGDGPGLAKAVMELMEDPERRRQMGERACQRAKALFDVRRTAEQMALCWLEWGRTDAGG